MFGPISIDTRLKLNQKPEADGSNWSIPKIDLEIFMSTLSLFVGKAQYQDVLLFLEAQERFSISIRHLKYRPNLIEYRQHFAEWYFSMHKDYIHSTCVSGGNTPILA